MTNFPHKFLEKRETKATFICGDARFHPYRSRVIESLLESQLDIQLAILDRIKSSQAYANSLISLNCSLNGDVNLRNLEIISAGGFLLTDQLSPQSGFDKLLKPGEHCIVYSSPKELLEKVAHYLGKPDEAVSIAKNAYYKFYESLHPSYRINDLYNWIFKNDKSSTFLNDYDSRFEISRTFSELLETRLAIYEQIQELHRLQENICILVDGNCEVIFAIDLVDLCRANVFINSNDEEKIKTVEQLGLAEKIHFSDNVIDREWDVYISKSKRNEIKAKFNILLNESDHLVYSPLQKLANFTRLPLSTTDGRKYLISCCEDAAVCVFNEIFKRNCYPILSFLTDVNVIVDVGASVGFATAYFRINYPDAKIFCFEPDPVDFLLLRDNCRQLRKCIPYLFIELDRADSFFIENGITSIDILKVDTEGCVVEMLRRVMAHNFGIKVVYIKFYSEVDRRIVDQLLSPHYILWSGNISDGHRGSLCYLSRNITYRSS